MGSPGPALQPGTVRRGGRSGLPGPIMGDRQAPGGTAVVRASGAAEACPASRPQPGPGLASLERKRRGADVPARYRRTQPAVDQQMLRLTSMLDDPDQAAEDMAQQLLSTAPDDWVDSF